MKTRKKLRIAQIAPLWFPIPPEKYGGIERIVAMLCDGLAARGHKVTLFAAPGSKTKAKLHSVFPEPLIKAGVKWSNPLWNLRNLEAAYELADRGKFDIVHSHLDVWTLFFQNLTKIPTVTTMHNPLLKSKSDPYSSRARLFREEAENTNIVFISKAARRLAAVRYPKARERVIYNAVDTRRLKFNAKPKDHFIWIARVDKYKGIENAIKAAEELGVKLTLAGRIDPSRRAYFKKRIEPRLSKKIRFVGELSQSELSRFYGSAKALLYPIRWEEPFGLVVAEAMACGTPVIAYDRGSMAELIDDGKTGFVIKSSIRKLTQMMREIDRIDRKTVRRYTEERFSVERMVRDYEEAYYSLL